ncbi:MAG TPA: hypothetical protein VN862_05185 [Candidatus Acidoferrales bacterium]|nr:hypothetical protein [Candidatus Acidoferrales bacterium]
MRSLKRPLLALFCALFAAGSVATQQAAPSVRPNGHSKSEDRADFLRTTDEVLANMSKLLGLPLLEPLKRSIRTRDEIRSYVVREMREDETPAQRYSDQREMEEFGLIPKGFPLDSFLVDLLTEQIAGLYDAKTKEFYIADWIAPDDQREVMAHELTHALQDQHYHLEAWRDAVKSDEDAQLARDAVVEGSAVASMLDYSLRQQGLTLEGMGELDLSAMLGNLSDSPLMAKAPAFIRDDLMFPYSAGADFSQHVLLAKGGWPGFHVVFENPPASTQQVMHPGLYMSGVLPSKVDLPDLTGPLGKKWKQLDSNVLGEFGLQEVLKQFLDQPRAIRLAALWAGDRYALYEQEDEGKAESKDANKDASNDASKADTKDAGKLLLAFRIHTASDADAAQLFSGLSDALQKKYPNRTNSAGGSSFLSFETDTGGVFLRCSASDCLTLEGADLSLFDKLTHSIGWGHRPPTRPIEKAVPKIAMSPSASLSQQRQALFGETHEIHAGTAIPSGR